LEVFPESPESCRKRRGGRQSHGKPRNLGNAQVQSFERNQARANV
jgi:hypothetical protein